MTSDQLFEALRSTYPAAHGWVLLPQVRDATGAGAGRTADALAMNTWPSRGLEVHGFELKISRHDWQRELARPAKAESIFGYCDRWWVVVPELPEKGDRLQIVRAGELPPSWGLLVVDKAGRCAQAEAAPKLKPKPLDRAFLAAVLRRLEACQTPAAKIAEAFALGRAEGIAEGRRLELKRLELRSARQELRYQFDAFQRLADTAERLHKHIRREAAALALPPESDEDEVPLWQKAIGFFEREFGYNADPAQVPAGGAFLRWALEQRQAERAKGSNAGL